MSTTAFWLSIGALVIVALFCINAIAYRIRYGTFLRRSAGEGEGAPLKGKLARSDVVSGMFICLALLIGVVVPVVASDSAMAVWLREPYAWLVYVVWCWLVATIIGVSPKVLKLLRMNSDV